jgi:hypothetical protein
MSSYKEWLAAMPVKDVRGRIAELEKELEVLRLLDRQHRQQNREGTKIGHTVRRRSLSPERTAIIELIRSDPEGLSPSDVAQALGLSTNAAQTTLSRMVQANQLVRVEQGRYRLPAHVPAADVLSGTEGGSDNGNGEANEP